MSDIINVWHLLQSLLDEGDMEKLRESKCYSGVVRAGEWTQMQTQNGGTGSDVKENFIYQ